MPSKKPKVMIYFDPDKLEKLKKWAEAEHRTVNNLITKLLDEALVKQESLKQDNREVS
jgi:hypothetical protein